MRPRSSVNSATWAPAPAPIYPVAGDVADSLANIAEVIGGVSAIRTNVYGRLIINVPAGTTALVVWLVSNVQTFAGFDYGAPVYVDGAYSSEILPAAIPGLQPFTLTLDGAAHVVEVWTGFQNFLTGTYVYAVTGKGISIGAESTFNTRGTWYGDSITGGAAAAPVGELGFFPLLRNLSPGTRAISQEAFGGRQLWDDCGSGSGQLGFPNQAALAARLVGLNFGAPSRFCYLAIGVNDINAGHWTAAQFGTNYGILLDALIAADPGVPIYAQSMLITTTLEGSAPAWRAQIQAEATARSGAGVVFVDGPALMPVGQLSPDGLHPSTAGHATIAGNLQTLLHW